MTEAEGTPRDAELDRESSTDEAAAEVTVDVDQEAGEEETTSDYQKVAEEKVTADYQTRMEEFDNVESSVPVRSVPTKSGDLDKDLEV